MEQTVLEINEREGSGVQRQIKCEGEGEGCSTFHYYQSWDNGDHGRLITVLRF